MRDRARPPLRLGYRAELDGLRGFAIGLVVACHVGTILVPSLEPFVHGGQTGVDVFFVLSGFLITTLLVEERRTHGHVALGPFYLRRLLRLMPAVAALLVVHGMYAAMTRGDMTKEWHGLVIVFAYSSNWYQDLQRALPAGLYHTWSLANEEQFYLLWPLMLSALVPVFKRGALIGVLLVTAATVALARSELWATGDYQAQLVALTFGRIDGLLVGCALALAWTGGLLDGVRVPRAACIGATAVLLALLVVGTGPLAQGGLVAAVGAATVLVLSAVNGSRDQGPALLRNSVLVRAGRSSYGMYLWHVPVFVAVSEHVRRLWLRVPLAVAVTICATALSRHAVEEPFLRIKRRIERTPLAAD